ncbi:hypothetical protein GC176_18865 [bacterium]|nr:hypothetical protein [bacterium]
MFPFSSPACRSLSLAVLAVLVQPCLAAGPDTKEPAKPAPVIARIIVSPQTTHFTEPLTDDGLVNLAAALNRHYGKGVAPENNASVVLYEVLGPEPDGVRLSDDFFRQLGVAVPPTEGDYFLNCGSWVQKRHNGDVTPDQLRAAVDDQDESRTAPWKRDDFPRVFEWLTASRGPLSRLAEGVQRPDYYSPLIPPEDANQQPGGLIASLLPGIQMSRELARALTSRAMLHLGERRYEDAWQDLLTTHRLGRQIGRGPTLIEQLVGIAIESIAIEGERTWLEIVQPGVKRIARIREQLNSLPAMSKMMDAIDTTERILFVDSVVRLARNQMKADDLTDLGMQLDAFPAVLRQTIGVSVDWNGVLRRGNSQYDEIVAAMRIGNRTDRNAALQAFETKLQEQKLKATSPGTLALAVVPGLTSAIVTEAMSRTLTSLLMPALSAASHAEERQQQRFANLQATLTLFEFRADVGEFPETIDSLIPKFADDMPVDLFSGAPLKYRRTADGFVLYSVGKNETDDGGRTFGDENPGDDLVVRISLAKPDSTN